MYTEGNFLQLSALQHFIFCKRQCALIHIEQQWVENVFTAEGRIMHGNVHEDRVSRRKGVRIESGTLLHSFALGLSGKADIVEFHKSEESSKRIPFPIEYKRGKPKADNCDNIQLCAQALCLEEMLKVTIPCGAIFYGKTRRRSDVRFDEELRNETIKAADMLHAFIEAGKTPLPVYAKKCDSCSFLEICMPKVIERKKSVKEYLKREVSKK